MSNRHCQYLTFSGKPCTRPALNAAPSGKHWCGTAHVKGTLASSGGRNGACSCGSGEKFKECCFLIKGNQRLESPPGKRKRVLTGFNKRRFVIGYERDSRMSLHILYVGPWYITVARGQ